MPPRRRPRWSGIDPANIIAGPRASRSGRVRLAPRIVVNPWTGHHIPYLGAVHRRLMVARRLPLVYGREIEFGRIVQSAPPDTGYHQVYMAFALDAAVVVTNADNTTTILGERRRVDVQAIINLRYGEAPTPAMLIEAAGAFLAQEYDDSSRVDLAIPAGWDGSGFLNRDGLVINIHNLADLAMIPMQGGVAIQYAYSANTVDVCDEDSLPGHCVVDCLIYEFSRTWKMAGSAKCNRSQMIVDLYALSVDLGWMTASGESERVWQLTDGITADQLVLYMEKHHPSVSLYVLDPLDMVITQSPASKQLLLTITIRMNGNHAYVVTDKNVSASMRTNNTTLETEYDRASTGLGGWPDDIGDYPWLVLDDFDSYSSLLKALLEPPDDLLESGGDDGGDSDDSPPPNTGWILTGNWQPKADENGVVRCQPFDMGQLVSCIAEERNFCVTQIKYDKNLRIPCFRNLDDRFVYYRPEQAQLIEALDVLSRKFGGPDGIEGSEPLPMSLVTYSGRRGLSSIACEYFNTHVGSIPKSNMNDETRDIVQSAKGGAKISNAMSACADAVELDLVKAYASVWVRMEQIGLDTGVDMSYPVFCELDEFKPFTGTSCTDIVIGLYLVLITVDVSSVYFPGNPWGDGMYPHFIVIWMLRNNLITFRDISFVCAASSCLPAGLLRRATIELFAAFEGENSATAKMMAVFFSGMCGITESHRVKGCVTTSQETAIALWGKHRENADGSGAARILRHGKAFHVVRCTTAPVNSNHIGLYEATVWTTVLLVAAMCKRAATLGLRVIRVLTDALYVDVTKPGDYIKVASVADASKRDTVDGDFGTILVKKRCQVAVSTDRSLSERTGYSGKLERVKSACAGVGSIDWIDMEESASDIDQITKKELCVLLTGRAGHGKSYLLRQMYDTLTRNGFKVFVVCSIGTNRDDLVRGKGFPVDAVKTFAWHATRAQSAPYNSLASMCRKPKTAIFVDECFQLSPLNLATLMECKRRTPSLMIVGAGCENQMGGNQLTGGTANEYDLSRTRAFAAVFGFRRMVLAYKECGRYDPATRDFLETFLADRRLPFIPQRTDAADGYETTVVFSNRMKKHWDKKLMDRMELAAHGALGSAPVIELPASVKESCEWKQDFRLLIGLRCMVRKNHKVDRRVTNEKGQSVCVKVGISNGEKMTIVGWDDTTVSVMPKFRPDGYNPDNNDPSQIPERVSYTRAEFVRLYDVDGAMTATRAQGITIKGSFGIQLSMRRDPVTGKLVCAADIRSWYAATSRCTSIRNVHVFLPLEGDYTYEQFLDCWGPVEYKFSCQLVKPAPKRVALYKAVYTDPAGDEALTRVYIGKTEMEKNQSPDAALSARRRQHAASTSHSDSTARFHAFLSCHGGVDHLEWTVMRTGLYCSDKQVQDDEWRLIQAVPDGQSLNMQGLLAKTKDDQKRDVDRQRLSRIKFMHDVTSMFPTVTINGSSIKIRMGLAKNRVCSTVNVCARKRNEKRGETHGAHILAVNTTTIKAFRDKFFSKFSDCYPDGIPDYDMEVEFEDLCKQIGLSLNSTHTAWSPECVADAKIRRKAAKAVTAAAIRLLKSNKRKAPDTAPSSRSKPKKIISKADRTPDSSVISADLCRDMNRVRAGSGLGVIGRQSTLGSFFDNRIN